MARFKAFTLIEILITVAIIGTLMTIGFYTYSSSLARSHDSQRLSDLRLMKNALEQFYLENRQYPYFENQGNNWIMAARWQLGSEFNASCLHNPATYPDDPHGRRLIAPFYMSSIPEDPQYKLAFTNNCAGVNSQFGQYLYLSLPNARGSGQDAQSPATGYDLVARLERPTNQNMTAIHSDPTKDPTVAGSYYAGGLAVNGLQFGQGDPKFSHNYYLTSGIND